LAARASAGFNWGAGCAGGNGSFTLNLTDAGQLATVGTIPAGKWNVKVFLSAAADVDVQIYDQDDTSTFPEGKAVVAWCADAKTCNIGALGSDEGAGAVTYREMRVKYSGYGGVDGKPGREYITIEGKASTTLVMKAFAFQPGEAVVKYEWSRVQTGCCLGIAPCSGSFELQVPKDAVAKLGDIPIGKKNLEVRLNAKEDVDIQLYDKSDTSTFSEGKAIIAYCDTDGCNKGALGNNDGTPESTAYKDREYSYSGYEGSTNSKGDEYLRVKGVSNTLLSMKAYGYAAGTAIVSYSYYEDYDRAGPVQPSVDWQYAVNRRDHRTKLYATGLENMLLLRRDGDATLLVDCPTQEGILADNVTVTIAGWVGDNYRFSGVMPSMNAGTTATNAPYPAGQYTVTTTQDGDARVKVRVAFAPNAPVGYYRLSVQAKVVQSQEIVTYSLHTPLTVLFNPYGTHDDVKQSKANREEYVEGTEGLIWQGLSDSNTAHTWAFDQFEKQQLMVSLDSLRRMPVAERGDAALVSRHLTYALGEDVCYGKWGSGSYTTGQPSGGYRCSKSKQAEKCYEPGHWTGTKELFTAHLANGGNKVQYCQCFVYAGVLTTIGRALGIPTRPVTNFQSAHDSTRDRAISKFYDVDPNTGVFTPATTGLPEDSGHDSIWSFHVWNEMYMKRPMLNTKLSCKTCANGWQTLDATPQEYSRGGDAGLPTEPAYMMGPAAVKGVVKKNLDPVCRSQGGAYGCFDSQFVISEVNSNILMWTRAAGASEGTKWALYPENCGTAAECGFLTEPFGDPFGTVGLQISTKKRGAISAACRRGLGAEEPRDCSKELDDITSSYKRSEPSGPGAPTVVPGGSGGGRRMLRAEKTTDRRHLSIALGGRLKNASLGMAPQFTGPVINEPGHPASAVTVGVRWNNASNGVDASNVFCALIVTVRDYASTVLGTVHSEIVSAAVLPSLSYSKAKGAAGDSAQELELAGHTKTQVELAASPGRKTASQGGLNKGDVQSVLDANNVATAGGMTSAELRDLLKKFLDGLASATSSSSSDAEADSAAGCVFEALQRNKWRAYASTYMDVQDGYPAMEPGQQAYMLHFEVTVSSKSASPQLLLAEEHAKIICTPVIGASLKSKIVCDDDRGQWIRSPEDAASVAHMAHLTRQACVAAGIDKWSPGLGSGPNNGVCEEQYNVPGCWDGGDCCAYSCFEKNGQHVKLKDSGEPGWEPNHKCFETNDTLTCSDPNFNPTNFSGPPLDFSRPALPGSFDLPPKLDNDQCTALVDTLSGFECDARAAYLCGDALPVARLFTECRNEIAASNAASCGSSTPRCGARTLQGCRCKAVWSHTSKAGVTTTFDGHACGNPYDGGSYEWHPNDWCEIVPGSCDVGTFDGQPGSEDDYVDGGVWWDNCGTGKVNPDTGNPISLEVWTAEDVANVTGAAGSKMSTMQVVSREDVPALAPSSLPIRNAAPSPSIAARPAPSSAAGQEDARDSNGIAITSGTNLIAPRVVQALAGLVAVSLILACT
jgi:hypothetical protein